MGDQLIDAAMARSLTVDAVRSQALFGWIVQNDPPEHPTSSLPASPQIIRQYM